MPAGPCDDLPDERQVLAVAECTVEIHHVDPAGALIGEPRRDRDRIIPINGLPRRLALAQANDAAMSDVDGGKEVHYWIATGATGPGLDRKSTRLNSSHPSISYAVF